MRGVKPPGGRYLQLYAADLGRGPDGRWWVLDDRTQAPVGRRLCAGEPAGALAAPIPNLYNAMNVQRLAPFFDELRKGLAAAADRSDPRICLLTPGPFSETYFEQAHLARYLGFLLVEGDDLIVRDGRVYVRTIAGLKRADVILRRVDADFIDPLELNSELAPGRARACWRRSASGGVAVLNMPGSGVLESKSLLGFLPKLCRRLLGEELKMPNVATWWCGQPARARTGRARASRPWPSRPAFNGLGPDGDHLAAAADGRPDAGAARGLPGQRFNDRPGDFVGQEVVRLSTTPVLRDGRLEPAPFVLRVYAAGHARWHADHARRLLPHLRPAGRPRHLHGRGRPHRRRLGDRRQAGASGSPCWPASDEVKVRRILGNLPSRAADNLFWLGRYLERAEATLRLVRSLCTSLMDSEAAVHATGETLDRLQQLLIAWGALDEDAVGRPRPWTPPTPPCTTARRLRLGDLPGPLGARAPPPACASGCRPTSGPCCSTWRAGWPSAPATSLSEAEVLQQVERALQILAALSGLAQENMNRGAGWRFLDMGRRIERGINTCRFTRTPGRRRRHHRRPRPAARPGRQPDHLSRPLSGRPGPDAGARHGDARPLQHPLAGLPGVRRSRTTWPRCRPCRTTACWRSRPSILLPLATEVETEDAGDLTADKVLAFEQTLMRLSDAIADRYFLQGANAVPTVKLAGLA